MTYLCTAKKSSRNSELGELTGFGLGEFRIRRAEFELEDLTEFIELSRSQKAPGKDTEIVVASGKCFPRC